MEVNSLQMNSMNFVKSKRYSSAPKTPQQNGIVERKNRTFQEAARTMLNEVKLPDMYWREAIYTDVYILNRGQLRVNKEQDSL